MTANGAADGAAGAVDVATGADAIGSSSVNTERLMRTADVRAMTRRQRATRSDR
jgi:hypothetical protein